MDNSGKGQKFKLQASGETIAAVHAAAIGQDGAGIIVEAFDRRGPASACPSGSGHRSVPKVTRKDMRSGGADCCASPNEGS